MGRGQDTGAEFLNFKRSSVNLEQVKLETAIRYIDTVA